MNRVALTFVIVCGVFSAVAAEELSSFVVGGDRAAHGQFPYRVSLRNIDFDDFHGCGGSILNENWLLTAAHCVGWFDSQEDLRATVAVAGSINPRNSGVRYNLTQFVIHPLWIRTMPGMNPNDVALVRTDRPIAFNDLVQPIRISRQRVRAGDVVVAAGWGGETQGLFPEPIMSEYLNVIKLNVISNMECRRRLLPIPGFGVLIRDNIFCTFNSIGSGLCSGDSGSGITLNGELVGVASMAIPCANGFPDWYPRLADYYNWIQRIISQ